MAQWLDQMTGRNLAWVALDAADNDPVRFWTHIATAFERAGCLFDGGAASLVTRHRADITSGLLPELVNSLAGARVSILLALDDYHFIRSAACHEQVDFLIEHLPAAAAVLILSRTDPGLRLGRLRAARQLAEIRADRLSFDADEATALLAMQDISLSGVALGELMERTEGWPAGLYLATMSLLGREDPDGFVHEFSGDNRYIVDYLIEEVLGRQSNDVRAFILETSIFEGSRPHCVNLCSSCLVRVVSCTISSGRPFPGAVGRQSAVVSLPSPIRRRGPQRARGREPDAREATACPGRRLVRFTRLR